MGDCKNLSEDSRRRHLAEQWICKEEDKTKPVPSYWAVLTETNRADDVFVADSAALRWLLRVKGKMLTDPDHVLRPMFIRNCRWRPFPVWNILDSMTDDSLTHRGKGQDRLGACTCVRRIVPCLRHAHRKRDRLTQSRQVIEAQPVLRKRLPKSGIEERTQAEHCSAFHGIWDLLSFIISELCAAILSPAHYKTKPVHSKGQKSDESLASLCRCGPKKAHVSRAWSPGS